MTPRIRPMALAAAFAAAILGPLPALADPSHDLAPAHGGVVVEARHVVYELVAKADRLQLHLRDHGKPMPVAGVSARLTLLTGTQKQEATLQAVGDRLEATGSFNVAAGTKVVAVVSRNGKNLGTARFAL